MPIIIGVTGTLSAGKDEFSHYLIQKGFIHISLSDLIREEAHLRGIALTRDNLRVLGNEMRQSRGLGILSSIAIEKMNLDADYVITSLRNPHEILELKKLSNFILIKIDAPVEIRFERALERNREEEKRTLEEFKRSEEVELVSSNTASQQLAECMKLADVELFNDSSLEIFHSKIDALLAELR